MKNPARFREFLASFSTLVDTAAGDERRIFREGAPLLSDLVRHDDWLPDEFAARGPDHLPTVSPVLRSARALLGRLVRVGPGVKTPIHDHTVWGMVGVMRGAENCHEYDPPQPGAPMSAAGHHRCEPGDVDKVSPTVGDVHVVENALSDRASVSIHVYGGNIGAVKRHVFDAATGAAKPFVSGYSRATLPNFWDRSKETPA